jgi:DNA-binding beta-propeller fold protein YncE
MRRRVPASFLALVVLAAGGGMAGAAQLRAGRSLPRRIGPSNVGLFADAFDATFAAALKPLAGRLVTLNRIGGAEERKVSFSIPGPKGTMKVAGFGLILPAPARWELTLTFGDFSSAPSKRKTPLKLRGALQFNFVSPRSGHTTNAIGLFRGFLELGGAFGGSAEVYGEVENNKVVSLVVTSGHHTLLVGKRRPAPFVSYVSSVAGSGTRGPADGSANQAQFNYPRGVAVGPDGNLYVADTANDAIRKVTPKGDVTTLATGLRSPHDLQLDGEGTLVVSADSNDTPLVHLPTSGGAIDPIIGPIGYPPGGFIPLCQQSCDGFTPFAGLPGPNGIDVQGGVIYVTQFAFPPSIRIVTPAGSLYTLKDLSTTLCGDQPQDVARGLNGDLYWSDCEGVFILHPDGTSEVLAGNVSAHGHDDGVGEKATFLNPKGIAFDGSRYLYVADSTNSRLRRIDVLTRRVVTIAGDGDGFRNGVGEVARLWGPSGIALDPWGDVYIGDEINARIRLVRIVTDPERDPQILGFEPYTMQQGTHAVITVRGRNLGLTKSASLGSGVQTTMLSQSSRELTLEVTVSDTAPTGTHGLTVTTFYGKDSTPPGLSLQVLDRAAKPATVQTIAGTGVWSINGLHDGPASSAIFALPVGIAAIDAKNVLVADPLEQRIRLLTKEGCQNPPCDWMAKGWAGSLLSPGEDNGARGDAKFFLPADVTTTDDSDVFYVADTGNSRARSVGLKPADPPEKNKDQVYSLAGVGGYPLSVADGGDQSVLVSVPERATIQKIALKDNVKTNFAGIDGQQGCEQVSGEPKPRLGIPLGMSTTDDDVYVADPFCNTVWKIAKDGSSVDDVKGPLASLGGASGKCSDGPVAFATFGAPVDVSVDKDGNIWVADAGCNSIREITDVWASKEASFIGGALDHLLGGLAKRLPSSTVDKIQDAIDSLQSDFIEANRYWVITVAGSRDGQPGFKDGLAGESLFNGPAGISAFTEDNGTSDIWISDAGNRRIRLLQIPA